MGRSYIRSSNIDYFPALIKSKQFIDTVEKLTIFIENKKENGEMENIFLKDKLDSDKSQIISAKKGYIINDKETNFLVLYDGKIINIDGEGTNIIKFKKTNYNLSNYETKTTTYPKIQEQEIFTLLKCINSFFKYNTTYKTSIFSCEVATINPVIQEVAKRFFSPLYILIITFIAGSLIFKSKSDFNYNKYRIILFLLGVISIVISEFSIQYITYKNIFNIPILTLPFLLTFIIYLTIIFNTKRKIN
jgi:Predicted permeases